MTIIKPTVGESFDTWGITNNAALDSLDTGKQEVATLSPDVAAHVTDGTALDTALNAKIVAVIEPTVSQANRTKVAAGFFVPDYYPNNTPTAAQQHAALTAACTAATAVGGTVVLDPGVTKVVGSFSMSGFNCSIQGRGTSTVSPTSNFPLGSVIECVDQTGPVLDFTGYKPPWNFVGRVCFNSFTVRGDGTADATNDTLGSVAVGGGTKKGIYVPGGTVYAANFTNIVITRCGGIPFDIKDVYLSEFAAITVTDPVNAASSNIPYARVIGGNGNRFLGFGLRCLQPGGEDKPADMGASGAIRLEASAFPYHRSLFSGCWIENLHVPSSAAVIVTQTNFVTHRDWQVFDTFKVSGATNTSILRMEPSTVSDLGGNIYSGVVEGRTSLPTWVDFGVDVTQSRNRIEGVKGFNGNNVRLQAGVVDTFVLIGGGGGAVAGAAAVIDSSGNTSNTIIDATLGVWKLAAQAGLTAQESLSGQDIRHNKIAATISTNFNPNMAGGFDIFVYTLAASGITMGVPSNAQLERPLTVMLKQDGTGSRTLTWNAIYAFKSGSAPVLKTAPAAVNTFRFVHDGTYWQEV